MRAAVSPGLHHHHVPADKTDDDAHNVIEKVDDHGHERTELNHRSERCDLLRRHITIHPHDSFSQNQMRATTNGNEFSEALYNTEDNCLNEIHGRFPG